MKTKLAMEELAPGETVRVLATDPEAPIDLAAWAGGQGHAFRELGPGEFELAKRANAYQARERPPPRPPGP